MSPQLARGDLSCTLKRKRSEAKSIQSSSKGLETSLSLEFERFTSNERGLSFHAVLWLQHLPPQPSVLYNSGGSHHKRRSNSARNHIRCLTAHLCSEQNTFERASCKTPFENEKKLRFEKKLLGSVDQVDRVDSASNFCDQASELRKANDHSFATHALGPMSALQPPCDSHFLLTSSYTVKYSKKRSK